MLPLRATSTIFDRGRPAAHDRLADCFPGVFMERKPTSEMEARGLKAYEQARAFERLRTWRLPLVYASAPLVPAALGAGAWRLGYPALFAGGVAFAVFIAARAWLEWKRLRRRYDENLALLATLEAAYGDALPWVRVENHFAALEALKREIAEERPGPNGPA
jgi:hypothetical protein